jgi:uncharacterized protein YcsI (UPF0317 family)
MHKTGEELRAAVRRGEFAAHTSGLARGFVQANLVILPQGWAYDFLLFAHRNPKPCPVLEVGDAGDPHTRVLADGADVRTDIPLYRIYESGALIDERKDVTAVWRDDFVFFLLGCSFTFEQALLDAGLPLRHRDEGRNVPMYRTSIPCRGAGKFQPSPMVVSMRPYLPRDAIKAVEITREFPMVHGSPVHLGDPPQIGISDIEKPDWGDRVSIRAGEIPVFWACGVTPQLAALVSKPPIMITHAPGHMFVGDRRDYEYKL